MKVEIVIGLSIFAVLVLYLIHFLIRQRIENAKQKRIKALAEYKARREEVELKARRQLQQVHDMNDNAPSLASLLKHGCQVTHYRNTRGWIECPDGRFFKPEPNKVRFIKGMNKPFVYTSKINKGLLATLVRALKKLL